MTCVGISPIHGVGWFAVTPYKRGQTIWRPRGYGGGLNRSCHPNAVLERYEERQWVVAVCAIAPGEEITLGYGVRECRCGRCAA